MSLLYSKHLAIAKITDPVDVGEYCRKYSLTPHKGSIWVSIPELGFEGTNLIYCRYGMAIPYIRVQEDSKLWVEATVGDSERWIYTGFADCGGDITPHADMQLVISLLEQVIYASTAGTMHLSADDAEEPFVLGNVIDTWLKSLVTNFNSHTHLSTAPGSPTGAPGASTPAITLVNPSGHLSTKIFGE